MMKQAHIDEIFGPGGSLEKTLANYEHREGQVLMARAVDTAIQVRHHLIVEAGTGTGKSLAYLIPAILSGKKTVISTLTKNLQEQLYTKDIPFIIDRLGLATTVCTVKGRANYLCLRRFEKFMRQPFFDFQEEAKLYNKLLAWAETTQTGDRAEIDFLPDTFSAWSQICSTVDTCIGKKCTMRDDCFVEKMKMDARESDLIIVNHHLLFADMAIKKKTNYSGVLPTFETLILDEAHEIEDVATSYFGLRFSSWQIFRLVIDTNRELEGQEDIPDELDAELKAASEAAQFFFSQFRRSGRDKLRMYKRLWTPSHESAFDDLRSHARTIIKLLKDVKPGDDDLKSIRTRWQKTIDEARLICALDRDDFVYWVEWAQRTITLAASQIELSTELKNVMFDKIPVIIMTSATLSTNDTFDFFKQRVGIETCDEAIVASPFDFKKQAVLYVPRNAPDPRSEQFDDFVITTVDRILRMTEGKAFVLFTSHRRMQNTFAALHHDLPMKALMQGDRPKNLLIQDFSDDMDSVLFATSSFWHGVDVVGASLSVVIIDKIPFSVPDEPVVEARIDYIKNRGGNAFFEFMVPAAIIALKQGFGRLIRSRSDFGLLVLLDPRFMRSSYAHIFQKSMPPVTMTTDESTLESICTVIRSSPREIGTIKE